MAYTIDISLALGTSKAGLLLAATLVDSDAVDIAGHVDIASGFHEIGNGNYLWHYESFPNGFRGGIKFYEDGVPGTSLAFLSINPEDYEYINKLATGEIRIEVSNERDTVEVDAGVSTDNIVIIPGVD
jgi:hypothetical protein